MKTKIFYIFSFCILLISILKLPSEKPFFKGMWAWHAIEIKSKFAEKNLNWEISRVIDWNTYMTQIILALLLIIMIKLLFIKDK